MTDTQYPNMQLIDKVMKFEDGLMDGQETVDFFGELVASGLAWQLQGMYGRNAAALIEAGYINGEGTVLMYPSGGE